MYVCGREWEDCGHLNGHNTCNVLTFSVIRLRNCFPWPSISLLSINVLRNVLVCGWAECTVNAQLDRISFSLSFLPELFRCVSQCANRSRTKHTLALPNENRQLWERGGLCLLMFACLSQLHLSPLWCSSFDYITQFRYAVKCNLMCRVLLTIFGVWRCHWYHFIFWFAFFWAFVWTCTHTQ